MQQFLDYLWNRLPDVPMALWDVLVVMAPYLLLGFLAAGLLSVLIPAALVERHLGGRGMLPVLKASIFGLPLPLCSCGVIPVAASLRRHGASRGATVSFLISTPQTGVENIAVTYGLLGGVFAFFAPIATFLSGLLGGTLVDLADRKQPIHKDQPRAAGECGPAAKQSAPCTSGCCPAGPAEGLASKLRRAIFFGFFTLPKDLGKALVVGLFIAAFLSALLPEDFFTSAFGGMLAGGIVGMLVMMALGVPVYVCATASIPMAWALIDKGVSPGAAFVFLVVGPATNTATIAMIWKVMGRRTAIVYLASMVFSALFGGLIMDWFFYDRIMAGITRFDHAHHHGPEGAGLLGGAVGYASAVILLALLAMAVFYRRRPDSSAKLQPAAAGAASSIEQIVDTPSFDAVRLAISGMTCQHCESSVRQALLAVAGVESVEVDVPSGQATVRGESLDESALAKAVQGAGYDVTSASKTKL